VQHVYYPLDLNSKHFKVSTKFKFTGHSANCFVTIGMAREIVDIHDSNGLSNNSIVMIPGYTAGSDYGEYHLHGSWRDDAGAMHRINEGSDWLSGFSSFKLLSTGTWYISEIEVDGNTWTLSLYDDQKNLIGTASNDCTGLLPDFNYVYIGNPTDYNFEHLYGNIEWVKLETTR